jgi:hypothetical protein
MTALLPACLRLYASGKLNEGGCIMLSLFKEGGVSFTSVVGGNVGGRLACFDSFCRASSKLSDV